VLEGDPNLERREISAVVGDDLGPHRDVAGPHPGDGGLGTHDRNTARLPG
jgi:hypothetical protein